MPGKVRVKIIAGRNLPVMDRGSDTTDAYVEIKFATITYKTDVYRKSLNPQWNSDWYRFEVDDAELQDEPLQIRIMDHDTYSANDAIGKVNISLNPLLLPIFDCLGQKMSSGKGTVMSGWIPVFDTMHGIRGEVNLIVKVDLFSDVNKFRQSSCGVQFFHSPNIPYGYHAQIIHGFVEELVVNDDPEYQWIDKIRTPRASNEARQVVFLKLSGQVQRKIGLKAIDLGANAVIGYIQCFDLEGDVGVVARGIGTAVTLVKIHDATISMGIFSTIQQQHFQQDSPAVIEERTRKYFEFLTNSNRNDGFSKFDSIDWSTMNSGYGCGDVSLTKTIPHNDRDIVYKILGLDPNEFGVNKQKTTMGKQNTGGGGGGALRKHPLKNVNDGIPEEVEEEELENEDGMDAAAAEDDLDENIKILCSQEDHRSETSKTRLKRRMKHFGKTSKCIIHKKMNVFKKSQPDSDSNNSGNNTGLTSDSYSDIRAQTARNSTASSLINSSIVDLRTMFTRYPSQILTPSICKQQNPKFQRSASDGVGMAALLVRSLMVAAPSLDSIAEMNTSTIQTSTGPGQSVDSPKTADTADHHHNHRNLETSEKIGKKSIETKSTNATAAGLEQRKIKSNIKKATNTTMKNATGSMINLSTNSKQLSDEMIGTNKHFKISDTNLSSHFSSRTTMSSPEDDEEEDDDDDDEDEDSEDADDDDDEDDDDDCESEVTQSELVIVDADTVSMVVKSVLAQEQSKCDGDWIKPGDSDTAAAATISPMSHQKSQFVNLPSNNNQRKQSIDSHTDWIQPGSTIDEPEISNFDTKRNSIFHDLKGNIRDKFHHLQEQLSGLKHHQPHQHEQHEIVENSLVGTALETMLVDKANVFGANPIITETTIVSDMEYDGEEHLHKSNSFIQHHGKPRRSSSIDSIKRFINNPFARKRYSSLSVSDHHQAKDLAGGATTTHELKEVVHTTHTTANESSGLTNMAMRTMLLETVNLVDEVVTHSHNTMNPMPPIEHTNIHNENTIHSLNTDNTRPSTTIDEFTTSQSTDNFTDKSQLNTHQLLTIKSSSSLIISDHSHSLDYANNNENINNNNENKINNNNNNNNNIIHTTNITNKLPLLVSNPIQFDRSMIDNNSVVTTAGGGIAVAIPAVNNNNNIVGANGIPIGGGGHIRADSVGCKGTHSPIKITTSTSSTVTTSINGGGGGGGGHPISSGGGTSIGSNSNKDTTICRRSSDSDLSVTPKELYVNTETLKCFIKQDVDELIPLPYLGIRSNFYQKLLNWQKKQDVHINTTENIPFKPREEVEPQLPTSTSSFEPVYHVDIDYAHKYTDTDIFSKWDVFKMKIETVFNENLKDSDLKDLWEKLLEQKTELTEGGSLNISDRPITTFGIGVGAPTSTGVLRITGTTTLKTPLNQDNLDMLEYPFLTMTKYPIGFILHIGATVCARSVKLLERVPNPDEPETRDSWWTELRMEIRSHARALGCNVVLGYTELTTISDEVCVLSVTGTAAVINLQFTSSELALLDTTVAPNQLNGCTTTATNATTSTGQNGQLQSTIVHVPATLKDINKNSSVSGTVILPQQQQPPQDTGGGVAELDTDNNIITPIAHVTAISTNVNALKDNQDSCTMCHIPYTKSSVPFNVHMKRCGVCRHGKVPDVLLATIEIPENIQITGRGCFLQAQVYRNKKDLKSESNAKEISDGLPFLEYDLHRLLINKLKAKGMNAIFGLKSSIAIGEKMMALVATGTAVFLTALPPPNLPKIVAGNLWTNTEKLNDLKKSLQDTVDRNREIYQLKSHNEYEMHGVNGSQHQQQQQHTSSSSTQFQSQSDDTDDSDDDTAEIDLTLGNKDTCVLEVDDIEDLEIISCLMEPCPPDGFHVVNTQNVPGLHDMDIVRNLQMFTQIWRTKFSLNQQCSNFPKHFQRLLQIIYFKLRTMVPCAIVDLKFRLDIPESEEVQILITGMALGLGDPNTKYNNMINTTTNNINNNNTNSTNSFGTMTKLNKRKIGVTSNQPQERLLLNKDLKKAPAALTDDELIFSLEEEHITDLSNSQHQHQQFNNTTASNTSSGNSSSGGGGGSSKLPNQSSSSPSARNNTTNKLQISIKERYGVDITPLSYVPGGKIDKYLGNLNFFFIRESTSIRENGGISGFVHSFITEVLAVARAHVTALGGNAMISFYMTELILVDNPHKNQGQCLISVGGDVVFVSYFTDD